MKLNPAESAAENARVVLPKMARKYFEAGRKVIEGKRPPDDLHVFRLQTKRFRYTLELFRPLYGPSMDRYLKALRELQGALGKISDYQAIQRVLSTDKELKKQIDLTVQAKLKQLRRAWRAFDSDGQLKRWRAYLGRDHSATKVKRSARTKSPAISAAKKTVGAVSKKAAASASA
jgi:CHAD domain-containing protein